MYKLALLAQLVSYQQGLFMSPAGVRKRIWVRGFLCLTLDNTLIPLSLYIIYTILRLKVLVNCQVQFRIQFLKEQLSFFWTNNFDTVFSSEATLYILMFVCPYVRPSAYLSVCPSVYMSVYPSGLGGNVIFSAPN